MAHDQDNEIIASRAKVFLEAFILVGEKNNGAASLIDEGRYVEAVALLGEALKAARQLMSVTGNKKICPSSSLVILDDGRPPLLEQWMQDATASSSWGSTPRITNPSGPVGGPHKRRKLDNRQSHICTSQENEKNNASFYLFNFPIKIPTTASSLPFCRETVVLASIALIFNLALSHQLAATNKSCSLDGRKSSQKKNSLLHKAAKLYELAWSMYKQDYVPLAAGSSDSSRTSSLSFMLATTNNVGIIHHDLNDAVSAEKYFQQLLSALMCIVPFLQQEQSADEFRAREQFNGYLRNATRALFRCRDAAAAA